MKEKTNKYMNWTGKEMQLTRDEFIKRWSEVASDCSKLISWRDMDGTQEDVKKVQDLIKKLAGYNFDLKSDDVHIHYDMDGKVDYHRIGKKYKIRNGKEV